MFLNAQFNEKGFVGRVVFFDCITISAFYFSSAHSSRVRCKTHFDEYSYVGDWNVAENSGNM